MRLRSYLYMLMITVINIGLIIACTTPTSINQDTRETRLFSSAGACCEECSYIEVEDDSQEMEICEIKFKVVNRDYR